MYRLNIVRAIEPVDVQAEQCTVQYIYSRCVSVPAIEPADVQAEQCTVQIGPPECNPVSIKKRRFKCIIIFPRSKNRFSV